MTSDPLLCVLLRTDRDEQLVQPGQTTSIEGDVEEAWLPVRCEACEAIELVPGHQTGVADRDMTETTHAGECGGCGQEIRGTVDYLHEQYDDWQPLANDNLTGGEPIYLADLADRVP